MKRRLFQGLVDLIGASRPPMPCLRQTRRWVSNAGYTCLIRKVVWPCRLSRAERVLVVCSCLFVSYWSHWWVKVGTHLSHKRAHMQSGLSPAVTPHSRQTGDICSLEIFLHYCHRGTSLNVCFPAPVLMRTCLLKWWSAWLRTFTLRRVPTDHMCDGERASRQMRCLLCSEQGQIKTVGHQANMVTRIKPVWGQSVFCFCFFYFCWMSMLVFLVLKF